MYEDDLWNWKANTPQISFFVIRVSIYTLSESLDVQIVSLKYNRRKWKFTINYQINVMALHFNHKSGQNFVVQKRRVISNNRFKAEYVAGILCPWKIFLCTTMIFVLFKNDIFDTYILYRF